MAQTYVANADQLEDAIAAAVAGDVIVVTAGGEYEISIKDKIAIEGSPITIKASSVGAVTLTGSSKFAFEKCAYIVLEGFIFDCSGDETLVKLSGCNNIQITRNQFELDTSSEPDASPKWLLIGGVWNDDTEPYQYLSHHNRIDHNIFKNKTTPGHYITVDGTNSLVQSQYDRIDHNYFINNGPRATNEQESIRIGWSEMSMSSGYTTVEYNLFEDCDGDPEIVSVKSCDNVIRHNTFLKSYGTLSLRHGNRNRVEGNYFFGGDKAVGLSPDGATLYTGGVRVYGTDHVIINNYFEGLNGTKWDAPITLTQGDAIDGSSTDYKKHFRAENVILAYNTLVDNTYGIEIGFDNNDNYNKELKNILFANNLVTGSTNNLVNYIEDQDQGSEISWVNNLMYPTGTASLTSDGSTFAASEVITENPFLVYDETGDVSVWRSTDNTPEYADASSGAAVEDIEGQTRPASSNPGADHYSLESVRYAPLTASDVGPYVADDGSVSEHLSVSSTTDYVAAGGTQEITVTSNVDWTVSENSDWITVSPSSGSDNGAFDIIVSNNATFVERSALVNVAGGSESRNISVTQEAADPTDGLTLINDGSVNDLVVVNYVFAEEITSEKNNIAEHSLDKDFDTQWSGEGLGGEIIYDLGGAYNLQLVDYAATNGKTYEFQIWVSSTGTDADDFSNPFTIGENLVSNTDGTFKSFLLPTAAQNVRYIKIIGYGQPARPSEWNTITEIEFYGEANSLSVEEDEFASQLKIYPIPAKETLSIKAQNNNIKSIKLFSLDGRMIMNKSINSLESEITLDVSTISKGTYMILLTNEDNFNHSKLIYLSN